MSDRSVHEIQLNGKQLVFMFMTATVAAVVIFLCGVMVGRGVSSTRAATGAAIAAEAAVDPTIQPPSTAAADTTLPDGPVSSQEDLKELTYAPRLEAPEPPPEPALEPVAPPVPAIAETRTDRAPIVAASRQPEASSSAPKGDGFVVQVASLRSRAEADAVAKRLSSKGFPSFVTTPGSSGPRVFRVRVGKYPERREAETVARRLEKEEHFRPWITR